MSGVGVLLEDGRAPAVRSVIGQLLRRSRRADFAVMRIRLAAVDLSPSEIAGVEHCRVLVGRLDASAIVPAAAMSARAIAGLIDFITSGRAEIRAAAGASWFPDFSVLQGIEVAPAARTGPRAPAPDRSGHAGSLADETHATRGNAQDRNGAACLIGSHFFAQPFAVTGPAFTAVLTDARAVAAAARRFDSLWTDGYDVGAVVASMLAERAAVLRRNLGEQSAALPAAAR